jgi:hypothetical protein
VSLQFPLIGTWQKRLDSSDTKWLGGGSVVPNEIMDLFDYAMSQESVIVFVQTRGIASLASRL